jgi:hypothetical protein
VGSNPSCWRASLVRRKHERPVPSADLEAQNLHGGLPDLVDLALRVHLQDLKLLLHKKSFVNVAPYFPGVGLV